MLSLSNEPHWLLDMTLDTLARVLEIECCWVQTIDIGKRSLHLAAERGFNSDMRREIAAVDLNHGFGKQVVGTGTGIVLPDLSRDGCYHLDSFRTAGYRWLVAMPLMTYRVNGVLGVASRYKKRLRRETADLVLVIAGLIGTALNKAVLSRTTVTEKPEPSPENNSSREDILPSIPRKQPEEKLEKPAEGPFHQHIHKMNAFRRLHQKT